MRKILLAFACAGLVGCQTTGEAYNVPDFTFPGTDTKKIKGALALQMTGSGWTIERDTDATIVFRTSKYDAGVGGALFTCSACQPPQVEASMVIAPGGSTTTVRYDLAWIMNPRSPLERRIVPPAQKGEIRDIVETSIMLARKRSGGKGPPGAE